MKEANNLPTNALSQPDNFAVCETTSNGLRIRYDDRGEGAPALLCMPGWCSNRAAFSSLLARCSKHRRALALDWRGHGHSEKPPGDYTAQDLLQDALAVIEASGSREIVPVSLSHAGWIAIELRRRLGPRIPKLVLIDWITMPAPPVFVEALKGLQSPESWVEIRNQLLSMWLDKADDPDVIRYVREEMGTCDFSMAPRGA